MCFWLWTRVSSETRRDVCRKYNKTVYSRILLDYYWHWFTMHGPMNMKPTFYYSVVSWHIACFIWQRGTPLTGMRNLNGRNGGWRCHNFFYVYLAMSLYTYNIKAVPIHDKKVYAGVEVFVQTCIPDGHLHIVTYTRYRIDTIESPDDEHLDVRNM